MLLQAIFMSLTGLCLAADTAYQYSLPSGSISFNRQLVYPSQLSTIQPEPAYNAYHLTHESYHPGFNKPTIVSKPIASAPTNRNYYGHLSKLSQPAIYTKYSTPSQLNTLPRQPPVAIVRMNQDFSYDGRFTSDFEAENGIRSNVVGELRSFAGSELPGQVMSGSFSYTSPEGLPITTTWYADETGYHAEGSHLPRPPAVPEAIAKSLEYIKSMPQNLNKVQIEAN